MSGNRVNIKIEDGRLILKLNNKGGISKDDFRGICKFLENGKEYRKFKKFEIDFGNTFFELSGLTEKLIEKSYLFKNREMQIVLKLGRHNLPNRLLCLHYLNKFEVTKYKINYF